MAKNPPNQMGPDEDAISRAVNAAPSPRKTLAAQRAESRLGNLIDETDEIMAKVGRGEMNQVAGTKAISAKNIHIDTAMNQIGTEQEANRYKSQIMYGQGIERVINPSASASRINGYQIDTSTINRGLSMSSSMSYEDVNRKRSAYQSSMQTMQEQMIEESRQASPNKQKMGFMGQAYTSAERGLAAVNVAMKDFSYRGMDPTSQGRSINDTLEGINSRETGEINKGRAGSNSSGDWAKLQQDIKAAAEALKGLAKAATDTTKSEADREKARKEAVAKNEEYKGLLGQEAAGRSEGANVSGKSMLEKIKNSFTGAGAMQAWGEGINQAGKVASYYGVQSQEQRMDLDIGFANMANRKFNDQRAALHGDMAAARRSGMFGPSAYTEANKVGDSRAKWAATGQGLQATGQGIKAVGEIDSAATSGDMGGTGAAAAVGIANASMSAIDVGRGITTGSAALRGQQQSLASQDANNHVTDAERQRAYDTVTGINRATFGGGSRRGKLLGSIASSKMVSQMADAMISQEQMGQLTAQGVQSLGSEMNAGVLSGAGRAQKQGLMSAGDYVGALGTMTGSGGGSRELEGIMKSAVAAGMDNSKNIQQMVAATADLASRSAAFGINSSSGSASIIAKGVQGATDMPANMRAAAAANAASYADTASKDTSLTLGSVIQWSNIGKKFAGADLSAKTAIAGLTPSEIQAMKRGDMSAARHKGLTKYFGSNKQNMNMTAIQDAENINREFVMGGIDNYGMAAPTPEIRRQLDIFHKTGKGGEAGTPVGDYIRQQAANKVSDTIISEYSPDTEKHKAAKGGTTKVDKMLAAGEQGEAKMFAAGMKSFGGSIDGFAKKMEQVAKNWKIDDKAAEKMSHSYDLFHGDTALFDSTVKGLMKWLDSHMGKSAGGGGGGGSGGSHKAGTGKAHWYSF